MPETSLITKIMNIKVPRTRRQVRSLLGLLNFYRTFMPRYGDIVAYVTELISGKAAINNIKWSARHEEALKEVHNFLSSKPFLRIPDLLLDFHVFTDVSAVGIGGCLCQLYSGQYCLTKYTSRKLISTEQHWSVSDQESLAVCHCIDKWSWFLLGRHCYVCSDHKILASCPQATFLVVVASIDG